MIGRSADVASVVDLLLRGENRMLTLIGPAGVGKTRVGLRVNEVIQNEEIMVKPVADTVKAAQFFSGYTILGDGRVALIIDTAALLQRQFAAKYKTC